MTKGEYRMLKVAAVVMVLLLIVIVIGNFHRPGDPPPFGQMYMYFDKEDGAMMLLSGGYGYYPASPLELWAWREERWSLVDAADELPHEQILSVYDHAGSRLVVVAQREGPTWFWKDGGWSLIPSQNLHGKRASSLYFDPTTSQVKILTAGGAFYLAENRWEAIEGDTGDASRTLITKDGVLREITEEQWEVLEGVKRSALRPSWLQGIVYDEARKRMVLFVLRDLEKDMEVWEFADGKPIRMASQGAPPGRGEAAFGYNPKSDVFLMYGGNNFHFFDIYWLTETWEIRYSVDKEAYIWRRLD